MPACQLVVRFASVRVVLARAARVGRSARNSPKPGTVVVVAKERSRPRVNTRDCRLASAKYGANLRSPEFVIADIKGALAIYPSESMRFKRCIECHDGGVANFEISGVGEHSGGKYVALVIIQEIMDITTVEDDVMRQIGAHIVADARRARALVE